MIAGEPELYSIKIKEVGLFFLVSGALFSLAMVFFSLLALGIGAIL